MDYISLYIYMCVCVCVCVCAQLCLTLHNPMYCSPPHSVHGIVQASIVEWVAISSSIEPSQLRECTYISHVSCITGGFFITESPGSPIYIYTDIQINNLYLE